MIPRGLYQKWRPQRFVDVVGQDAVVQTLRQAVAQGRVAHAYLFAGPRGTGKTSTARILAKALNCRSLDPGTPLPASLALGEPDNACPLCLAVNEGRSLDLIEMDAASQRGIEEVRNLRERVFGSGPAQGRCKVYILDEVHMLTEHAFNALLKTLEEPAPWAYFILCTTEPQKVLATIVSRCQRFDFRRITAADVVARLETVCRGEGVEWEPEALRAIARASWGSLRDACNILEQAVVAGGSPVTLAAIQELLGLTRDAKAVELVRFVLAGDLAKGLATINEARAAGTDLRAFHQDLVEFLRAVLLLKSQVPQALDYPAHLITELQAIARDAPWSRVLRAVKLFGEVNLRTAEGASTLPLELALVECVTAPNGAAAPLAADRGPADPSPRRVSDDALRPVAPPGPSGRVPGGGQGPPSRPANSSSWGRPNASSPGSTAASGSSRPGPFAPTGPINAPPVASEAPLSPRRDGPRPEAPSPPRPGALMEHQWDALCRALKRVRGNKYVLGSLLLDCRERYTEGDALVLVFRTKPNLDRLKEELEHPPSQKALQEAIQAVLGRDYALRLDLSSAPEARNLASGHLLRAAIAMGAKVVEPKEEKP